MTGVVNVTSSAQQPDISAASASDGANGATVGEDTEDIEQELFGLPAGTDLASTEVVASPATAEAAFQSPNPLLEVLERLIAAGEGTEEIKARLKEVEDRLGREEGGDLSPLPGSVMHAATLIAEGEYVRVLTETQVGRTFFATAATAATGGRKNQDVDSLEDGVHQALNLALTVLRTEDSGDAPCPEDGSGSGTSERAFECLCLGIALLNLYLQANYSGPSIPGSTQACLTSLLAPFLPPFLPPAFPRPSPEKDKGCPQTREEHAPDQAVAEAAGAAARAFLNADGEGAYPHCVLPHALLLARLLLHALALPSHASYLTPPVVDGTTGKASLAPSPSLPPFLPPALASAKQWAARACVLHRRLLPGRRPTPGLWAELCLLTGPPKGEGEERGARAWLEWGMTLFHFMEGDEGVGAFEQAREEAGMRCRLTAAMGKRTKYQEKALPQMVLVVEREGGRESGREGGMEGVGGKPVEVKHGQDSILLDATLFEEGGGEGGGEGGEEGAEEGAEGGREGGREGRQELHPVEQAVLLALCLKEGRGRVVLEEGGLVAEQLASLRRPGPGPSPPTGLVYSTALLERSWLDFRSQYGRERRA
ncbi:hypothetical protein NSK_006272, partial [Nannochloropsis salina CCMP1776]